MTGCVACGAELGETPHRCRYCEEPVCGDHRLPENHDCVYQRLVDAPDSTDSSRSRPRARSETRTKTPLRKDASDPDRATFGSAPPRAPASSDSSTSKSPPVEVKSNAPAAETRSGGRSVSLLSSLSPGLVPVLLLAGLVIAASAAPPGVIGLSDPEPRLEDIDSAGPAGDELNETHVEQLVVAELNRERSQRDLDSLATRTRLSAAAGSYAETMAEYGDSGHELGGTTPQERYGRAGVACRYTGENAAKTWYRTEISTLNGARYHGNASELAHGLISGWMRSPPHREIMLSPRHTAVGVGVSIKKEDGKWAVYAVQDFCA